MLLTLAFALFSISCSSSGGRTDSGTSGDGGFVREFDLATDFSFSRNPNGAWRYGYTRAATLAADEFLLDAFATNAGPIGFWHPADGVGSYYPYVAQNRSGVATTDLTNSWAVRPGEVALEASNTGQYSVIEFVVPQSGRYQVQADFEGVHFRLSTTDVHVRHGDTALFDANIEGYGGDSSFHAIEGSNPRASYWGAVMLRENDRLIFAVGYGEDQTNYNDSTGLFVHIRLLP